MIPYNYGYDLTSNHRYDNLHNDIQHNDTEHNSNYNDIFSIMTLSIKQSIVMLSVQLC